MKSVPMRAARGIQLGLLASDLARTKRGSNSVRARAHVVERLGKLHGLPQKIGQILSLGELNRSTAEFAPLTEAVGSVPFDAIAGAIESELQRPIGAIFERIEPHGIAASLSQVHQAQLPGGRTVAVKVQYPEIEEALWSDLRALGWISAPVGNLNKGFDLAAYEHEVKRILAEELDYHHEADMMNAFAECTSGWNGVEVPLPVPGCSAGRVLTMTWLHGTAPAAAETWTSSQKHMAAHTLLKLFLTSCFEWRMLHGDPHAGNIRLRLQDGQPIIGLLDFGCTRRIDPDTCAALRALIDRTIAGPNSGDADEVFEFYLRLGFNADLLHPMKAVLPELTAALFAPFAERGPFAMDSWRLGERVAAILGDHRWNFRMAGPAHLLVLLRAYQGLLQYLTFFNASLNWRQVYAQIDHRAVQSESQQPLQNRNEPAERFASTALRIQVLESGRQKVALSFNARAAAYLKDLLPDDIAPKLVARGIDIDAIERSVAQTEFAAGELFALSEGEKRIRVWLE